MCVHFICVVCLVEFKTNLMSPSPTPLLAKKILFHIMISILDFGESDTHFSCMCVVVCITFARFVYNINVTSQGVCRVQDVADPHCTEVFHKVLGLVFARTLFNTTHYIVHTCIICCTKQNYRSLLGNLCISVLCESVKFKFKRIVLLPNKIYDLIFIKNVVIRMLKRV